MRKKTHLFNKFSFFVFGFILLLCLVPFFLLLYTGPYRIAFRDKITGAETFFIIEDSIIPGGRSTISQKTSTEDQLVLECVLKSGFVSPFAGFGFHMREKSEDFFDLSRYEYIQLALSSSRKTKLTLELGADIRIKKDDKTHREERKLSTIVDINAGKETYRIPLDSFKVPLWWLNNNPGLSLSPDDRQLTFKYAGGMGMIIQKNNVSPDWEEKTTLVIEEIGFYRSNLSLYIICALAVSLYVLFYLLARFLFKGSSPAEEYCPDERFSRAEKIPPMDYKKLDLTNYKDEELKKILLVIQSDFKKPDFTVETVYKTTGINTRKISALLKAEFSMAFKQYINRLRIDEAKKLLQQTEDSITDIAFQVGYNNLSNFYRVFKDIEKCAPGDFKRDGRD